MLAHGERHLLTFTVADFGASPTLSTDWRFERVSRPRLTSVAGSIHPKALFELGTALASECFRAHISTIRKAEMKKDVSDNPIPELSVVKLTHPLEHRAKLLPEGTVGTIVHAWSDGEHYAVEFTEPFPCIVSVARADIRPLA